jgi:hypothetical protein
MKFVLAFVDTNKKEVYINPEMIVSVEAAAGHDGCVVFMQEGIRYDILHERAFSFIERVRRVIKNYEPVLDS